MSAWSYSSLTAFETCPRRYYLTRVLKVVKEEQTAATLEGNELHKALELDVAGKQALPPKYRHLQPLTNKLRAGGLAVVVDDAAQLQTIPVFRSRMEVLDADSG